MAEEAFGPRLESLARTLLGVVEQQVRHATRIEALVAILRKVEEGQAEREAQILQTFAGVMGLCQLTYAHLLGVVESRPRAAEITTPAQAKMRTHWGEGGWLSGYSSVCPGPINSQANNQIPKNELIKR